MCDKSCRVKPKLLTNMLAVVFRFLLRDTLEQEEFSPVFMERHNSSQRPENFRSFQVIKKKEQHLIKPKM